MKIQRVRFEDLKLAYLQLENMLIWGGWHFRIKPGGQTFLSSKLQKILINLKSTLQCDTTDRYIYIQISSVVFPGIQLFLYKQVFKWPLHVKMENTEVIFLFKWKFTYSKSWLLQCSATFVFASFRWEEILWYYLFVFLGKKHWCWCRLIFSDFALSWFLLLVMCSKNTEYFTGLSVIFF